MPQIMIIDDSPTDTHILQKILEKNGYQTVTAQSGDEGIEVARRERPALILMDMGLPDIDGVNATRRIKANDTTAHIPIIALTADVMQGDREQFLAAGCDGYLAKPVGAKDWLAEIKRHLA